MTMTRAQMKNAAKAAIHDTKPSLVWITLVYLLIVALLNVLALSVGGDLEAMGEMMRQLTETGSFEQILPETTAFGNLLVVAMDFMSIVLGVGFTIACLNVSRRLGCSFGNLFDGFGMFFRALGVELMISFIVGAWMMLYALIAVGLSAAAGPFMSFVCLPLLIPAYRAVYAYRQATFLMIDNAQLNAFQCLVVSKRLMMGHKWELFVMDLSFLGWDLLCLIPFVGLWVRPYKQTTYALYYSQLMLTSAAQAGFAPPPETPEDAGQGPEE